MRPASGVLGLFVGLGVMCLGAAPVLADEAKTPVSAGIMLNILSTPAVMRANAFDASLKDDRPAPRSASQGEVLPDGSVRYGSVTVTVKNPCPPGTTHYEPPPLPGRRAGK
jgi:hypothetical protein